MKPDEHDATASVSHSTDMLDIRVLLCLGGLVPIPNTACCW